jgi:hypothetical protein
MYVLIISSNVPNSRYYAICHPTLFQANRERTNVSADCVIAAFAGMFIQLPNMMEFDVRFFSTIISLTSIHQIN